MLETLPYNKFLFHLDEYVTVDNECSHILTIEDILSVRETSEQDKETDDTADLLLSVTYMYMY